MKCGTCGANIKDNSRFCSSCGTAIEYEEPKPRFSRPPEKYSGPKKLYRSRSDRWVAGVCGGLGNYFNVDSNLIRLIWVLFTLAGGAGLLAYIIFVIVIPESPYDPWSE